MQDEGENMLKGEVFEVRDDDFEEESGEEGS